MSGLFLQQPVTRVQSACLAGAWRPPSTDCVSYTQTQQYLLPSHQMSYNTEGFMSNKSQLSAFLCCFSKTPRLNPTSSRENFTVLTFTFRFPMYLTLCMPAVPAGVRGQVSVTKASVLGSLRSARVPGARPTPPRPLHFVLKF